MSRYVLTYEGKKNRDGSYDEHIVVVPSLRELVREIEGEVEKPESRRRTLLRIGKIVPLNAHESAEVRKADPSL